MFVTDGACMTSSALPESVHHLHGADRARRGVRGGADEAGRAVTAGFLEVGQAAGPAWSSAARRRAPGRCGLPDRSDRPSGSTGSASSSIRCGARWRSDFEGTLARRGRDRLQGGRVRRLLRPDPAQVLRHARAHGLEAPSATSRSRTLRDELGPDARRAPRTMGTATSIVPLSADEERRTPRRLEAASPRCSTGPATAAKAAGIRFGYPQPRLRVRAVDGDGTIRLRHPAGGDRPRAVTFEMDLYWITKARPRPAGRTSRNIPAGSRWCT